MMIYSKPCVLDPWDIKPKSRGSIGSSKTPRPIPKNKDEFIKEEEFKI